VVGACGALVSAFPKRAEIVLADVNRQPPKSATRSFPVRSHSLGRCRDGRLPPWRAWCTERFVKTERAQGARKRAAGARRIAQRACAANITWGHSRGRQQCRLLAARPQPQTAHRPRGCVTRDRSAYIGRRTGDPRCSTNRARSGPFARFPFCQVGRRVIDFCRNPSRSAESRAPRTALYDRDELT
jgi:hypothetical protein